MQPEQLGIGLGGDGVAAVSRASPIVVVASRPSQFLCCFQFQCQLRFFYQSRARWSALRASSSKINRAGSS